MQSLQIGHKPARCLFTGDDLEGRLARRGSRAPAWREEGACEVSSQVPGRFEQVSSWMFVLRSIDDDFRASSDMAAESRVVFNCWAVCVTLSGKCRATFQFTLSSAAKFRARFVSSRLRKCHICFERVSILFGQHQVAADSNPAVICKVSSSFEPVTRQCRASLDPASS